MLKITILLVIATFILYKAVCFMKATMSNDEKTYKWVTGLYPTRILVVAALLLLTMIAGFVSMIITVIRW